MPILSQNPPQISQVSIDNNIPNASGSLSEKMAKIKVQAQINTNEAIAHHLAGKFGAPTLSDPYVQLPIDYGIQRMEENPNTLQARLDEGRALDDKNKKVTAIMSGGIKKLDLPLPSSAQVSL